MPNYSSKICFSCKTIYTPTSPRQKYCVACKHTMTLINQKKRDKLRNRKKHDIHYNRICPICKNSFVTYYPHKKYCGSKECEYIRKHNNSILVEKNRNIIRAKLRTIKRAKRRSEKLKEIIDYISIYGYTLISAVKDRSTHNSVLKLKCPEGHLWETSFHAFKDNNCRCMTCYTNNNYISNVEQKVRDFLETVLSDVCVIYNDRNVLAPKELDFYFPRHNLAIEICGLYWHGELSSGKPRAYHYDKMMSCFNKNIRLLTIFEDELIRTPDIVFSRIRQAVGMPEKRIYARKCKVRKIDFKTANKFFRENHIQGATNSIINIGLYYNDKLVCAGSLGKVGRKHTSNDNTIELKRFCTLNYYSVVGGVGKVLKRMKKYAVENNYTIIKSYCDMRYGNIFKPVYQTLGFELDSYTKYTPHYFKQQTRYRNYSLRKTKEERLTNKTEWELRQNQGYDRIWDCGHRTYIYRIN